ncbi:hypothetical protein HUJ05_003776 [Dendroctonus ponderosae]|nr:hypothetical protein HUJ05_003776 [Dendroctonus ponderosae]
MCNPTLKCSIKDFFTFFLLQFYAGFWANFWVTMSFLYRNVIFHAILIGWIRAAEDDFNIVHKDGSFEFGYNNPDSYHFADGNRNNVVRGEFGGRNPKTGAIDTTVYTAGPRGFRPRGKNVHRKYDLNQNGPRPIGSPDDPYYDPYEDPSYNFAFQTRTYTRQENANRVGDVNGRYTYLDDVGERHNVEYIAGKKTGFHVKTPFPDSNPRAYGPLYFRGRGRPIPRGRTSIQRGLDGSYKFVSAGPDQRRTEVSDSTGHVRGSYTYLDDKGVQHSVHYIAGPETGYRVLKTVKGAHLPAVLPFDRPEIVPPDFYDYNPDEDFNVAASGRPFKPGGLGTGVDVGKEDFNRFDGDKQQSPGLVRGDSGKNKSNSTSPGRPFSSSPKPGVAGGAGNLADGSEGGSDEDFEDNLFDSGGGGGGSSTARPSSSSRPSTGRPSSRPTGRPSITSARPSSKPFASELPGEYDDGSYKPDGDDCSYRPASGQFGSGGAGGSSTTSRPVGSTTSSGYPSGKPSRGPPFEDKFESSAAPDKGPQGGNSGRPFGGGGTAGGPVEGSLQVGVGGTSSSLDNSQSLNNLLVAGGEKQCAKCKGTIVTNVGQKPFNVPPGLSVRAHVQSIDLYPFEGVSPSEAFKADSKLRREQLNEASTEQLLSFNEGEADLQFDGEEASTASSKATITEND